YAEAKGVDINAGGRSLDEADVEPGDAILADLDESALHIPADLEDPKIEVGVAAAGQLVVGELQRDASALAETGKGTARLRSAAVPAVIVRSAEGIEGALVVERRAGSDARVVADHAVRICGVMDGRQCGRRRRREHGQGRTGEQCRKSKKTHDVLPTGSSLPMGIDKQISCRESGATSLS